MYIDLNQLPLDWPLTPVKGKKAFTTKWQSGTARKAIANDLKNNRADGVALILGEKSGIVAVDLDGSGAIGLWEQWEQENGRTKTIEWTSGRDGRKCLIFSVPPKFWGDIESRNYKGGNGDEIEIRWGNRNQTLPPSIHPGTNKPYYWINSPQDVDTAIAPDWLIEKMLVEEEKPQPLPAPSRPPMVQLGAVPIPIEVCMSVRDRDDLAKGVAEGGRNQAAFRIGVNAIAVERELQRLGYSLANTAEQIYWDFCRLCGLDQKKEEVREAQATWQSAIKSSKGTSLTEEALVNCANSYIYRETRQVVGGRSVQGRSGSNLVALPKKDELTYEETVKAVKEVLGQRLGDIDELGRLIEIESRSGLSGSKFNAVVRACRSQSRSELLEEEIKRYRDETDPIKRMKLKSRICGQYQLSGWDLKQLIEETERKEKAPKKSVFTMSELMAIETKSIDYLVPGLLPKGEMVVLAALAKVGKTLLAADLSHAVISGGEFMGESVRQGKVLVICSDQSKRSTLIRLKLRGTSDIEEIDDRFRFMEYLDVGDLSELEKTLSEFRPDLVVIDSLTSISQNSNVSEYDPAIVKPLIVMRDLIQSYGASSILIHHEGKSRDHVGISKISGSARIPSIAWAVWQLSGTVNKEGDIVGDSRFLKITPRDGERVTLSLSIKPRGEWLTGMYEFEGEHGVDDESKSLGDRVTALLQTYSPKGLEFPEINQHLNAETPSLYKALDRLEDRRVIGRRKSQVDRRKWVYYIGTEGRESVVQQEVKSPPPSPIYPEKVQEYGQNHTQREIQELDIYSTDIRHPNLDEPPVEYLNPLPSNESRELLDTTLKKRGGGEKSAVDESINKEDVTLQPDTPLDDETAKSFAGTFLACENRQDLEEAKEVLREAFGLPGQNKVAKLFSDEQRRQLQNLPSRNEAEPTPEPQPEPTAIAKPEPQPEPTAIAKPEPQPEPDFDGWEPAKDGDLRKGSEAKINKVGSKHHGKEVMVRAINSRKGKTTTYEIERHDSGYIPNFPASELMKRSPKPEPPLPKTRSLFDSPITDSDRRTDLLNCSSQQELDQSRKAMGEDYQRIWQTLTPDQRATLNALPEFDADD